LIIVRPVMRKLLSIFALICWLVPVAQAQIITDTEDDSNSSPTIEVRVNPNADTTGMANRPGTGRPPSPVPYSSSYTPTTDRTPLPTAPTEPQPGFPGATPAVPTAGDDSLARLFDSANQGRLRNCSINPSRNRDTDCDYEIIVDGQMYPFHLSVCSSNDSAARVGCNYGEQRLNAACILKQAMAIGHCR